MVRTVEEAKERLKKEQEQRMNDKRKSNMKKETLQEIILGTVGGLVFAVGMCMYLIPEWDLFNVGVIVSIIGFIILLCIIPVYKKEHPKKERKKVEIDIRIAY